MTIQKIAPQEAQRLIDAGATLIDIRSPDEYARERIPEARNVPAGEIMPVFSKPVVFHCRSGMRTEANAAKLAASVDGSAYLLEGGIEAWKRAGLPVERDRSQPIEIMRQVQIAAGSLIVLSVTLGLLVSPVFYVLAGLVGCGLLFAGLTGWCGMATLLAFAPWNRRSHAGMRSRGMGEE